MRRRGLRRFAICRFVAIRFAVVGSLNTAIDLGVFTALTAIAGLPPDRANGISYSCGIVTSFILNRGWTFADSRGGVAEQFTRFIVVSLASLLLSTMVVTGLSVIMAPLAAKLVSVPVMFVWNYGMTRRFVFWSEG
jgi:putative flippase GtrA